MILTVCTKTGDLLMWLSWSPRGVVPQFVADDLRTQVATWIAGFDEWVREDSVPTVRTTRADDPQFLPRLARYLERQYPVRAVISDEVGANRQ